jgi:hypothetical protein
MPEVIRQAPLKQPGRELHPLETSAFHGAGYANYQAGLAHSAATFSAKAWDHGVSLNTTPQPSKGQSMLL